MSYNDMMNAQELVKITPDWNQPIEKGTLIGFIGITSIGKITAAYPVWRVIPEKKEIQFVLYVSSKDGSPCIDNTWFTSDNLYINKKPIVVDISNLEKPKPFSVADRMQEFFK